MQVARVVGNVWAERKHENLKNAKLLLVQAIEGASGKVMGEPALAVDKKFGAGPGQRGQNEPRTLQGLPSVCRIRSPVIRNCRKLRTLFQVGTPGGSATRDAQNGRP